MKTRCQNAKLFLRRPLIGVLSMLKVGFIGLGAISNENVLGYLGSDDCDLNPAAGKKWLEKWSSHAHLYTDFHEMLSREDLDLVEILTPHHLHCQQAMACARAGVKGISLQKPMAVTLDECDRIIPSLRGERHCAEGL